MKKISKLLSLIMASLVLTSSCEKKDDDLLGTNSFEIIKPTEIENDNMRTKIVYENDLVVKINIEIENTLPDNSPMGAFYGSEFEKDTFSFEYKNKKLSNIYRTHHQVSFNGLMERFEEQINVEYNSDNIIKSISFSYPVPGKKIFNYDSKSRISKIEYEYDDNSLTSLPNLLNYNDNDNLTSFCVYSDSNCSDASQYDKYSNPYYSINQLLGYPFFTDFQHLSKNNPLTINNIDNTTNIIYPTVIKFSYVYDAQGRVVKINDNIEFKY